MFDAVSSGGKSTTGKVVAGTDVRLGLLSSITRDDLSEFLIDEALSHRYKHCAVFVRNQGR